MEIERTNHLILENEIGSNGPLHNNVNKDNLIGVAGQITNGSLFARAYQLTVSSSASANYYPSSISISGQGRIYYLAQQPGLYVYDIILQPGATANIDVSSAAYPFTPNNYVINVY